MTDNLNNTTAAREDIYRLLAACFYPPSPALAEEGCCASLAELTAAIAPEAAVHAVEAARLFPLSTNEEQLIEYTRLFLGPFKLVAPPYGSVWMDEHKTVMGESTQQAATFYHNCGLALAEDFNELPDHITVELEFLSFLVFKQREAEAAGDVAEAARVLSLQREYLDRFALPWFAPFAEAVIKDAESPFYTAVAKTLAAFVAADRNAIMVPEHG